MYVPVIGFNSSFNSTVDCSQWNLPDALYMEYYYYRGTPCKYVSLHLAHPFITNFLQTSPSPTS